MWPQLHAGVGVDDNGDHSAVGSDADSALVVGIAGLLGNVDTRPLVGLPQLLPSPSRSSLVLRTQVSGDDGDGGLQHVTGESQVTTRHYLHVVVAAVVVDVDVESCAVDWPPSAHRLMYETSALRYHDLESYQGRCWL